MAVPHALVLLSLHGEAQYLQAQLESLESQRGVTVSLLVWDDGATADALNVLQASPLNARTLILTGPTRGLPDAYLHLLNAADPTFDLYALCDQDDIWRPEKLLTASQDLELARRSRGRGSLLWICGYSAVTDSLVEARRQPELPSDCLFERSALIETVAPGCCMVFDRDFKALICQARPDGIVMHDSWAGAVAVVHDSLIINSRKLVMYRQHSGNVTGYSSPLIERVRRSLMKSVRPKGGGRQRQAMELQRRFPEAPCLQSQVKALASRGPAAILRRIRFVLAGELRVQSGSVTRSLWVSLFG